MSTKIVKRNDKKIMSVFGDILILMVENNTDNIELSFDIRGFNAKFKVELMELKQNEKSNK